MLSLIPMAGAGNRYYQDRYNVPKPFIPIMGRPMFITATRSFPESDRYVFLCLQTHVEKYKLKDLVARTFNNAEIVTVDQTTEGQACTCLLAENKMNPDEALFIASCDYQMIYDREKYQQLMLDDNVDVIIWTFKMGNINKANPKSFAYCRTDGDRVIEVVEKRTISDTPQNDPAVVGSFTFKKSEDFVRAAGKMIAKNIRVNNEFYVGTSINQLIEEGKKVVRFDIDKFVSFGTPVELMTFEYWQEYYDRLDDHPYNVSYGFKRYPHRESV